MIIRVEQTKSNLKNRFEIKVNNELKYLAGTPWMDIKLPLNMDNTRRSILTTIDEKICYITSYDVAENVSNSAIPIKWTWGGKQKSSIYNIVDGENNNCAKFYKLVNGFLDTKYIIEFKNYTLKCYDISVGKTRNISIYKEEQQIAEIVKPLHSADNLDYYYVFLLDEYSELEGIISFFTIYFDYQAYSNNGEFVASKEEVKVAYTFDKNNKFYNKNWINDHFNSEEVNLICNQILEDRKNTTNKIKKKSKYILLYVGLGWLILLIGVLIYFLLH